MMLLLSITILIVSSHYFLNYYDNDYDQNANEYIICKNACENINYKTCTVKLEPINSNYLNYPKSLVMEYNSTIKTIVHEKINLYNYQVNQTFLCYFNETSNKIEYMKDCVSNTCGNPIGYREMFYISLFSIFILISIILFFNIFDMILGNAFLK